MLRWTGCSCTTTSDRNAHRKGNSARFVAVHEPFTMVQLIVKVSEVRPGVIAIQTISALDEIVVEPGKFEYTTSSLR